MLWDTYHEQITENEEETILQRLRELKRRSNIQIVASDRN